MHQLTFSKNKLNQNVLWVSELLPEGMFIAGGALRCLFDKTPLADIDVFKEISGSVVALNTNLVGNGFKKTFTCPKGELHTWKHFSGLKVQLVCYVMGTPEQLLPLFDFTASQFALLPKPGDGWATLIFPDSACLRHARRKQLVIHRVTHPYATFNRIDKYKEKGYYFSNEECAKFVFNSAAIPFSDADWAAYLD